jgi:hypothetical protein
MLNILSEEEEEYLYDWWRTSASQMARTTSIILTN